MLKKTKNNTKIVSITPQQPISIRSKLLFYALLEYERYLRNKKCQTP